LVWMILGLALSLCVAAGAAKRPVDEANQADTGTPHLLPGYSLESRNRKIPEYGVATHWISLVNYTTNRFCRNMQGQCNSYGYGYLQCNQGQDAPFMFYDPVNWNNTYSQQVLYLQFRIYGLLGCGNYYQYLYFNGNFAASVYPSGGGSHCYNNQTCNYYCDYDATSSGSVYNYNYFGYNMVALEKAFYNNTYMCIARIDVGIVYNYTIACPRGCSGNGYCLSNGTCQCYSGWTGYDCSQSVSRQCCVYYQSDSNIANGWCQLDNQQCPYISNSWRLITQYHVKSCSECQGDNTEPQTTDLLDTIGEVLDRIISCLSHHRGVVLVGVLVITLLVIVKCLHRRRVALAIPVSAKPTTPI